MAAPNKQGLDYFKYYPGLLRDRKLRPVRVKYGAMGVLCYLALLELVYNDKGYYVIYDDDLIWDIMEVLQGAHCPREAAVRDVVAALVASGLFDAAHFERQILTSRRIQLEYYTATVLRKAVKVDFSIWLLSEEEMAEISERSSILCQFRALNHVNEVINPINDAINPVNSELTLHSNSYSTVTVTDTVTGTGNAPPSADAVPAPAADQTAKPSLPDLPKGWVKSLPIMLTPHAQKELAGFLAQGLTKELVEWAARETAERKASWPYMKSILENKLQLGIRDVSQLPGRKKKAAGSGFEASYDIAEFEAQGFTLPEM